MAKIPPPSSSLSPCKPPSMWLIVLSYEWSTSTSTFSKGLVTTQQGGGSASCQWKVQKQLLRTRHWHPPTAWKKLHNPLGWQDLVEKRFSVSSQHTLKCLQLCVARLCKQLPPSAARGSRGLYFSLQNSSRRSSPCLAWASARGPGPAFTLLWGRSDVWRRRGAATRPKYAMQLQSGLLGHGGSKDWQEEEGRHFSARQIWESRGRQATTQDTCSEELNVSGSRKFDEMDQNEWERGWQEQEQEQEHNK